jgi:photosystem II stability/assembly factor-like uncharacterized protein
MRTEASGSPGSGVPVKAARLAAAAILTTSVGLSSAFANPPLPPFEWHDLGPTNLAGRILDLEFDPHETNTLYAATAGGGLWRSTDGGLNWSPLTDELPTLAIGAVAVLPSDPDVILVGTGEGTQNSDRIAGVGILRSTDAGQSWQPTSLSREESSGHGFHVMEVSTTSGTLLAGATDGLWRSSDDGATWAQVKVGGDYYDAKWSLSDPNRVYACKGGDSSGNGIKVSTDDGITWTKAGSGQPYSWEVGKTKLSVTPDAAHDLYAIFASSATGNLLGVYRSTDDGAVWNVQTTTPNIPEGQGWYNLTLQADPDDADRIIAGGVRLYRSTNAGISFAQIGTNIHVDHHGIAYRPGADDNVFVATDGGIWESTNDGGVWSEHNIGLVTCQFHGIAVNNHPDDPDFLVGCVRSHGVLCRDSGTDWYSGLGIDAFACTIDPDNGTTVYVAGPFGGIYKSVSRCASLWTPMNNGITGMSPYEAVLAEDQTPGYGNHLYTSTSNGLFRTTNGGASWVLVATHQASSISISPLDGNVVWTLETGGAVKHSTDRGASWSDDAVFGFATGSPRQIVADPSDVSSALVVFSGSATGTAHVAITTDFGMTWRDATGNLPCRPVNDIAVDPENPESWFAGTSRGVWATNSGGTHWTPRNELPSVPVTDLEIQTTTHKLFAATYGRGVWELELDAVVPGVPLASSLDSRGLFLSLPRPNPSRGEVVLRYAAAHEGAIDLSVVDVQGRRVARITRQPVGDGSVREFRWNPGDVPPGVYFVVLRAGEKQASRKIVLAR